MRTLVTALEVHLERELAEAAFVVGASVIADAAFGGQDRGNGISKRIHTDVIAEYIVGCFLEEQVVVVEDIEPFGAEFEVEVFADGELLGQRKIDVPEARSAEGIAAGHVERPRAPIRN